ncbi:DEAD/DEAH box helicase [Rhodotorula paludigena]|uniref:DEAD/DEAH box helicase n=1 Tax=Rhodotorula paludigena TaxID=86838 RepID=UPI0031790ADF
MSDSEASASGSSSGSRTPSAEPVASTSRPPAASSGPSPAMLTTESKPTATFASLGLLPELCTACASLGFTAPSQIQQECIPYALEGRDIIGLAQTGSGKTAAFALPILHALWEDPQGLFAVVLAPTRELAYQISDQFTALGSGIGVRVATIVGGMDTMAQQVALAKKPHVIVATPGRLQDHLENTKGFSLRSLRYLVMDEADRLLDLDFGPVIDKILKVIPRENRKTYLFSATMTTKVAKLQRASLRDPVKLEVSSKYQTVSTLLQYYLLVPLKHKDLHLVHLLHTLSGLTTIVFVRTVMDAQRLSILLRLLSFPAVPLHGQLSQSARLGALNKFKSGGKSIMIATDVASRGLDIPSVDLVVNYDLPTNSKDYIHRVGRTARAGRSGKSVTLVTQYDVELFQRIEGVIGKKMAEYPLGASGKAEALLLAERVGEAQREAIKEVKEAQLAGPGGAKGRKRGRGGDDDERDRDDDQREAGMPSMGGRGGKRGRGGGKRRR